MDVDEEHDNMLYNFPLNRKTKSNIADLAAVQHC
jgi:hypothetical protein